MGRGGALGLIKQLMLGASAIALFAPVSANADDPSRGLDGLYVGLHAGYGFGNSDVACDTTGVVGAPLLAGLGFGCNGKDSFNTGGAIGGAQLGYNWRFGAVLLGIEGDVAFSGIDGDTFFGGKNELLDRKAESELDWLATVRGRAGFFATRDMVFYGTGGIAWGSWNDKVSSIFGSQDFSTTYTGWTAGAGVEAIVAKGVSVKLEYLYVDFGDETYRYGFADGTTTANFEHDLHTVKLGVNFKLN